MNSSGCSGEGFTLVELMVVVLIIGILVTIAAPVYLGAAASAQSKSCQANQRTIMSAIAVMKSEGDDLSSATTGEFVAGGSGWYSILVPDWIKVAPTCPSDTASSYYIDASGQVTGDSGAPGFRDGHQLVE